MAPSSRSPHPRAKKWAGACVPALRVASSTMTATPHAAPPQQPAAKPLSKFEQLLLEKLWGNIKPRLDAAFVTVKTKLLDALKGQPLVVIGGAVAAIDTFLLKGPKPMAPETRSLLEKTRAFVAVKLPAVIDKILEPPKPISSNLRKALAAVVTLAGALGIWQRVQPATQAPPTIAKK